MMHHITFYLIEYLTYFVGGCIQILFILLPVTLKNWEDDSLNSLTYIFFQVFVAGMIFIIAPWVLEVKIVSFWAQIALLGSTGIVALLRVIKLIPLEFTYPTKLIIFQSPSIFFEGFNTNERYLALYELDFQEADAELRYNKFRETLLRIKTENENTVLEENFDNSD